MAIPHFLITALLTLEENHADRPLKGRKSPAPVFELDCIMLFNYKPMSIKIISLRLSKLAKHGRRGVCTNCARYHIPTVLSHESRKEKRYKKSKNSTLPCHLNLLKDY